MVQPSHSLFFSLVLGFLLPLTGQATSLLAACNQLTDNNKTEALKCLNHAEFFELDKDFIQACGRFHHSLDLRLKCLKSGANKEILQLCEEAKWSMESTLICLRSYPTVEVIRSCKKFSAKEDEQIHCVRLGRDASQVNSCAKISTNQALRMECLQMDAPSREVKRCAKGKDSKRLACLEKFVAQREKARLRAPASEHKPNTPKNNR